MFAGKGRYIFGVPRLHLWGVFFPKLPSIFNESVLTCMLICYRSMLGAGKTPRPGMQETQPIQNIRPDNAKQDANMHDLDIAVCFHYLNTCSLPFR